MGDSPPKGLVHFAPYTIFCKQKPFNNIVYRATCDVTVLLPAQA